MKRISFRQGITLVLFVQLLLLLWSGIYLYVDQARTSQLSDAYLRLDSAAALATGELNGWISEGVRAVAEAQHLAFLHPDWAETPTLAQLVALPSTQADFVAFIAHHPALDIVSLLDSQTGITLLSNHPDRLLHDHSQDALFLKGQSGISISPLMQPQGGHLATYAISAPIHGAGEQNIAVIVVELNPQYIIGNLPLSQIQTEQDQPDSSNQLGDLHLYVVPPQGDLMLQLQPYGTVPIADLGADTAALVQADKVGHTATQLVTGEHILMVHRPLSTFDASVLVWMERATALAGIRRIGYYLFFVALFAILFLALVSHYVTFWLLAPLRRIADGARRLQAGQMAHRMEVDRSDEFGQLAQTFNEMAASLQAGYGQLEEQVRDRTADLTAQNRQLQEEIQDRQRAEVALRQREKAYWDLFEHAPISLWQEDFSAVKRRIDELTATGVTDLAAYFGHHEEELETLWLQIRILNVNQATLRMMRAESKDLLLAGLRPLYTTSQRAAFLTQLEALAQGRTHLEFPSISTRMDGEIAYNNIYWSISPGHERDASNVLVAIHDVTELKQASDLNRLQSAALNAADNSIVITDHKSVIKWVNPAFTRLTGYTLAEAMGATPNILYSGRHPDGFYAELWKTVTAGKVWRGVIQNRHKDNHIYLEEQTITPVIASDGQISHFIAIKQDVTDQIRIEDSLKRQLNELQVLQTIATLGTQIPDEDAIIQRATQVIGNTFYPDHFGVVLLEPNGRFLRPHASYQGVDEEALTWRLAITEGVAGQVVSTGQSLCIGDVTKDARFLPATQASRSELCVPLMVGKKVLGVINAESHKVDAFGLEDERLLATIAGQLATAIERARLFAEAKQRNQELTSLHDLSLSIGGILKSDDLLRYLAERLSQLVTPDSLFVALYDEIQDSVRLEVVWEEGRFLEDHQGTEIPLSEGGLTNWVIKNRQALLVNDLLDDDAPVAPRHITRPARSWLGVPLMVRGQIIGAISVQSFQPGRFLPSHQRFMESLASQAAIAIENATLFDQIQDLLSHTQAQAQQVQQIIETVPEGVLLLDARYRVVLANPTAQGHLAILTGQERPETITVLGDLSIHELLNPLAVGEKRAREVVTSGAERRIFEVDARPMQQENALTGWVMVVRDVTQERRHQEYLHAQERLATVGQLAAGIAHDFNNIMGAIVLYAQMLNRQATLSPKHSDYLHTIRDQAHHASNLIRQILDFSRRSTIERKPLDLDPFMHSLVKMLARTLPENIEVILPQTNLTSPLWVMADTTRLQQAMMNLAVNARDAMPGGGHLAFAMTRLNLDKSAPPPLPDMPPGHWIGVRVTDSGEGINPQILSHIFEPFYSTKPKDKGTGLGLAQVYGIVKQHDGFIGVESQLGEGTTFTLYLPAMRSTANKEEELADEDRMIGGNGTILIVEDNTAARVALEDVLAGMGYAVLSAVNGEEALAIYAEHQSAIALVLSDMVMPKLGGVELFHALVKRNPGVKLIIMTGYPLDDGGANLLEQGILDWLPKPFNAGNLAKKVAAALG